MQCNYNIENAFKLYDYLPIGVCIVDRNYKVLYWNKCLEGWTNRLIKEMIGKNLIEEFNHLNEPTFRTRFDLMFDNKPPMVFSSHLHKYIFPIETPSGKYQSQYATLTSLPAPNGDGCYLLIAIENITNLTERVNSYKDMKNQALDELRKRQTIELKLKHYTQQLEDSNATKDKFFSIIAHDLIGPITSQFNLIDSLIKDYSVFSNEEIFHSLLNLKNSAGNSVKLLDNLLTWSRSQLNKIELNKEIYNLYEIITNILSDIDTQANYKNISILSNSSKNTNIYCDLNLVVLVLRNILSNAIKFTPTGGKIIITSEELENELRIDIIDNGVGMNEETVTNLFKPDKVISTIGTDGEVGTGLGLLISYEFVRKHNGHIEVSSKINVGSVFSVYLPKK